MRFSPLAFAVSLAGVLAAQEPARQQEPEPGGSPGPLLEVRAGAGLLESSLIEVEPPEGELPEDGAFHLVLDADQELRIDVGDGDPGTLWLRADPAGLLRTYREHLGLPLGVLRGLTTMALIQEGVTSKEAIGFFEALVDAPKQVREVELRVRETGPGIVEADLHVRPAPDTWFAEACAGLRALPEGAPVLREANAMASLSVAVDPEALPVLFEPLHELYVAVLTPDRDERARIRSVLRESVAQLDGSLALSVDEDNERITQMIGIRDGEDYRRLRETEDYELLLRRMMRGGSLVEVRRMPDALKHRGVTLARSAMRLRLDGLGSLEGIGDSRFSIYNGLVEDLELAMQFDPDYEKDGLDRMRDLVDRTLDGHIRRMPIPDGALARGEFDLRPGRESLETLFGTFGIHSEPPTRAIVELRRADPGLHLRVRLLF